MKRMLLIAILVASMVGLARATPLGTDPMVSLAAKTRTRLSRSSLI
jgi:hypothetical protein